MFDDTVSLSLGPLSRAPHQSTEVDPKGPVSAIWDDLRRGYGIRVEYLVWPSGHTRLDEHTPLPPAVTRAVRRLSAIVHTLRQAGVAGTASAHLHGAGLRRARLILPNFALHVRWPALGHPASGRVTGFDANARTPMWPTGASEHDVAARVHAAVMELYGPQVWAFHNVDTTPLPAQALHVRPGRGGARIEVSVLLAGRACVLVMNHAGDLEQVLVAPKGAPTSPGRGVIASQVVFERVCDRVREALGHGSLTERLGVFVADLADTAYLSLRGAPLDPRLSVATAPCVPLAS